MERIKTILSVALPMWTGILLIYTFEMNPLIGFLISAVLWRLTRLDGKRKLNAKKLLLIALLVSVSGNYKASDFIFNAAIGVTVFQAINFFTSSKEESRQSWLPMVYVSIAIYYTLRMTLVFEVPEIFSMPHEWKIDFKAFKLGIWCKTSCKPSKTRCRRFWGLVEAL